ncbi:hypothetical protein [Thermasporomyces composti]|jgi:hypothetical protein|uniref:Uncharacterized protein n=1 Tax=Thermasporomyces composti TaxID=696763 RepID=A0A3D9V3F7_THECX|nr:hypothetical protein [Thermasporomyces composti]REF36057.1 hypothetical protein DFJ64_1455 [Thermasporomyces composti]
MPRNSRKSFTEPNPLYVLAGAGDLAVEKLRELSRMASDTIGSLESADPVAVSDRVQQTIEARADAIARTIRTASLDLRTQARDMAEKAQSAFYTIWIQAGDTYDTLARRGKNVVIRLRQDGAAANGRRPASTRGRKTATSRSRKSTTTRGKTTTARGRTNASTTRKRAASGRSRSSSSASRKSSGSMATTGVNNTTVTSLMDAGTGVS